MKKLTLDRAIAIASTGFVDRYDKAGEPYILHCIRVMEGLHNADYKRKIIAILHDAIEDRILTMEQLIHEHRASKRIVDALTLLTHDKNIPYDEYIKRLSHNEDARLVKLSDLKDNSNIMRLKGLTKKDFDRMEKYHRAYTYLSNV